MRSFLGPAVLLLASAALAQEAQQPPAQQPQPQQPAAAEQAQQPAVLNPPQGGAPQPQEEYGGPAILSRGSASSISREAEFLRLRPFISVDGIYDSELAAYGATSTGTVPVSSPYGVATLFGVTGFHPWQTSSLALDYRGSYTHYNQSSAGDIFDNSLMLTYQRQLSRHFAFSLSEEGAIYRQDFAVPAAAAQSFDTGFAATTSNTLFNTRTIIGESGGQFVYQASARTSLSAGVTGYIFRPQPSSLIGSHGVTYHGDIAHRLTRFQTIGVTYSFETYDFNHAFGSAAIQDAGLVYSARLGRRWELNTEAGASYVGASRTEQVPVTDPTLIALFGPGFSFPQLVHQANVVPHLEGQLSYSLRRSLATIGYRHGVLPGNGVFLTSVSDDAYASYSYNASRRLALQASGGYSTYSALTQTIGKYSDWFGGGGGSYRLARSFSFTTRLDARHYSVTGTALSRTFYQAIAGFMWSPGDYPLAIW